MDKKLEKKLFKEFSFLRPKGGLQQSLMYFGMDIDSGWFDLIYKLCQDLQKIIASDPTLSDFQVLQVKEKFGCYDKETEILTREGWKLFKDLTYKDEIATLSKEGFLEYEFPLDIISYYYEGLMYRLRTRGVDLLVTPNHNLYLSKGISWNGRYHPPKRREFPFELATPSKYFGKNKRFKKSAFWKGKRKETFLLPQYSYSNFMKLSKKMRIYHKRERELQMDKFLEFLGWYVAEGYTNKERGDISIAFNPFSKEAEIITKVIEDLGFKSRISQFAVRIYSRQLGIWLVDNCGHLAPNKRTPRFIKELSPDQIDIYLKALFQGDGHKTKTSYILSTTSPRLKDDVQELLLKTGFTSRSWMINKNKDEKGGNRVIMSKHPQYGINWLKKSSYHNTQEKGLSPSSIETWIPFKGNVFDVTVSNHVIYVRRDGKPFWCGNSLRFYVGPATDEIFDLIHKAEDESYNICEICGKSGSLSVSKNGWYKTVCPYHRRTRGFRKIKVMKK